MGPAPLQRHWPQRTYSKASLMSHLKPCLIWLALMLPKQHWMCLLPTWLPPTLRLRTPQTCPCNRMVIQFEFNNERYFQLEALFGCGEHGTLSHRAFPNLGVYPAVVDGRWVIHGDPTCYVDPRDSPVKYADWHKWLMWRSDGIPAKHPTFALFAYKENFRHQPASGPSSCCSLLDLDRLTRQLLWEEFLAQWQSGDDGQHQLRRKLQYFAGECLVE